MHGLKDGGTADGARNAIEPALPVHGAGSRVEDVEARRPRRRP